MHCTSTSQLTGEESELSRELGELPKVSWLVSMWQSWVLNHVL